MATKDPASTAPDVFGRTCAYISLDLTGVRQQAKGGGAAEGRMPYVAMVFNPVPELPDDSPHRPPPKARMQARYLSGLYDLAQLGIELRKQAGQVGMDNAEVWIGLTDGGNGLEEFVRRNFSRDPVLILDFWHASDYQTRPGAAAARRSRASARDRGLVSHLEARRRPTRS